jgi:putative transposase
LMRNHWHFVLWPRTDDDVSTFFHELSTAHAGHRRRATNTVGYGHVYQDRFKAFPIFTESYYFTAMRYVEGNAYRAKLVTSACEWRWSSLNERCGNARGLLDDGPLDLPPDWKVSVDASIPEHLLREIRRYAAKY